MSGYAKDSSPRRYKLKMKERKRTTKRKFNPAEYAHLTADTPLIGWIWEFARRSTEYQEYWSHYQEVISSMSTENFDPLRIPKFVTEECPLNVPSLSCKDPSEPWDDRANLQHHYIDDLSKSAPVDITNLEYVLTPLKYRRLQESHYKPAAGIDEVIYTGEDYVIMGSYSTATKDAYFDDDETQKRSLTYVVNPYVQDRHPLDKIFKYQGRKNILMAMIDISASMSTKDIARIIERGIGYWKKRLGIRSRSAKKPRKVKNKLIEDSKIWKSYLVIYDLRQRQNLSFREISDLLSIYDESYASETKIKRHYDAAEDKINGGGYKKYL